MRQIIALGSGGFSDERSPGLDRYILEQVSVSRPRILFIPTASGDSDAYLARFYKTFSALDCKAQHLPFFSKVPALDSFVRDQDIIYVGGGNTKTMLAVWKAWNLVPILRDAYDAGVILCGISAGAMCWFQNGVTNASATGLAAIDCLGFAPGSCCPHYSDDLQRRPRFHELISQNQIPPGIGIDDDAALHLVEGSPRKVVVGRANRDVYRVELSAKGSVIETPLAIEHVDVSALPTP
jgi:peptidase E